MRRALAVAHEPFTIREGRHRSRHAFGGGILGPDLKGIQIIPSQFPAGMLTLPVGGFLVLGCLIAFMQWALAKSKNKEESK